MPTATYIPNPDGQARFYKAIHTAANAGLTRAATELKVWAQRGMGNRSHGRGISSPPGTPPHVQRGDLLGSVSSTISTVLKASAGSNHPSAMMHEKGGTIRATRSKYLPVPLNLAAQRLLERSGATTQFINGPSGGTGWLTSGGLRNSGVQLDFIPRPGKPPLLVGRQGPRRAVGIMRGGGFMDGTPVFILKKSIRLPARPWLMPALDKNRKAIYEAANDKFIEVFRQQGFGMRGSA